MESSGGARREAIAGERVSLRVSRLAEHVSAAFRYSVSREATVCHVLIDDARGCDISSIISVSTTSLGRDGAATVCSVGGLWLQQELILVRRNGEWRHKKTRRGPPWGGARSRLARSLAV